MNFEQLSQILPKLPEKWNVFDVGIWLEFIGFQNLIIAFSIEYILF